MNSVVSLDTWIIEVKWKTLAGFVRACALWNAFMYQVSYYLLLRMWCESVSFYGNIWQFSSFMIVDVTFNFHVEWTGVLIHTSINLRIKKHTEAGIEHVSFRSNYPSLYQLSCRRQLYMLRIICCNKNILHRSEIFVDEMCPTIWDIN